MVFIYTDSSINIKEVLRYLGYKGSKADSNVIDIINECILELKQKCTPKSVFVTFDIKSISDGIIDFNFGKFKSFNLSKNLYGCEKILLFAATLGTAPDIIIKKYTINDISRAVIMQAVAAAYIEQFCDEKQSEIEKHIIKEGLYIRPRFSPGYGDFDLSYQNDIARLTECPKKIGLSVTESFMLAPSKSVTAIIGASKFKKNFDNKCSDCNMAQCNFKRN